MFDYLDFKSGENITYLELLRPDGRSLGELKNAYKRKTVLGLGEVATLSFCLPNVENLFNIISSDDNTLDNIDISNQDIGRTSVALVGYQLKAIYSNGLEIIYLLPEKSIESDKLTVETSFTCYSREYELSRFLLLNYKGVLIDGEYVLDGLSLEEVVRDILGTTYWDVDFLDSGYNNLDANVIRRSIDEYNNVSILATIDTVCSIFGAVPIYNTQERKVSFYKANNYDYFKYNGLIIDDDNYLKKAKQTNNTDDLVTRLYMLGKNDLTINDVNPTGTSYIEDLSYFIYPAEKKQDVINESGELPFNINNSNGELLNVGFTGKCEQITYTGKNLLKFSNGTYSNNGITAVANNGEIVVTGTCTGDNSFIRLALTQKALNNNYTLSFNAINRGTAFIAGQYTRLENTAMGILLYLNSYNDKYVSGNIIDTIGYIDIRTPLGTVCNYTIKPQLEQGTVATSYEPYVGGIPSPSPDYPVPIYSSGDEGKIQVWSHKKNLFDKDNIQFYANNDGAFFETIDNNKIRERTTSFEIAKYGIKTNTNYVVSGMPTGWSLFALRTYNTYNGTNTSKATVSNNSFIITDENVKYIYLLFSNNNSTAVATDLFNNSTIQIERGSTPTPYEPYFGSTTDITTPVGYVGGSLPNGVADTDTQKKIGKIVLNGSESWQTIWTDGTNTKSFLLYYSDIKGASEKFVRGMCDKFLFVPRNPGTNNITNNDIEAITIGGFTPYTYIGIRINKSRLTANTLAEFKTWLSTNPVTVYYELATPVDITITKPTTMLEGSYILDVTNNIKPSSFNISYKNKEYLVNHSKYMSDSLVLAELKYEDKVETSETTFETLYNQKDAYQSELIILENQMTVLETELDVIQDEIDIYVGLSTANDDNAQYVAKRTEKDNKDAEITAKQGEIDAKQSQIDGINSQLTTLYNSLKMENNFTNNQLKERQCFIYEGLYTNTGISIAQDLYDEGCEYLEKKKEPSIVCDVDIESILSIKSAQSLKNANKIKLGEQIDIYYNCKGIDIDVRAQILGIEIDEEANSMDITIANTLDYKKNSADYLENILKRSVTTSTMVDTNIIDWNKGALALDGLDNIYNQGIDAAKIQINAAVDNTVVTDARGITIYSKSNPLRFVRQTNGVIALTKDGGRTYSTAITPDGVLAERLIGQIILGQQLFIQSDGTYEDGELYIGDIAANTYSDVKSDNTAIGDDFGLVVSNNTNNIFVSLERGFKITTKTGTTLLEITTAGKVRAKGIEIISQDGYSILDGVNILQSWQDTVSDSCDASHPVYQYIYVPSETSEIRTAKLSLRRMNYRAYSTATGGGGASTQSTTSGGGGYYSGGSTSNGAGTGTSAHQHTIQVQGTSTSVENAEALGYHVLMVQAEGGGSMGACAFGAVAGGKIFASNASGLLNSLTPKTHCTIDDHSHWVNYSVPSHTHDVSIQIPSHTHDLSYGISEQSFTGSVTVKVGSTTVGTYSSDQTSVNIKNYLTRGAWNIISYIPSGNARVQGTIFIQAMIGVPS